jgi:hypothetical protein
MNPVDAQSNKRSAPDACDTTTTTPVTIKRSAVAVKQEFVGATAAPVAVKQEFVGATAAPVAVKQEFVGATAAPVAAVKQEKAAVVVPAATAAAKRRLAASASQRIYSRKLAVQAARHGVTVASAKGMPLKQLSQLLRNTVAIRCMKLVLHRICVLTAAGAQFVSRGEETKNVNVRVFLAAFMITFKPDEVFESIHKNSLEEDLIRCGSEMLAVFSALFTALRAPATTEAHRATVAAGLGFHLVLHNYLKAFQAWKLPDEKKITARITHALGALYAAEDHLMEEQEEEEHSTNGSGGGAACDNSKQRAEYREQQERLREKLFQIAGEKAVKVPSSLAPHPAFSRAPHSLQHSPHPLPPPRR